MNFLMVFQSGSIATVFKEDKKEELENFGPTFSSWDPYPYVYWTFKAETLMNSFCPLDYSV